MKRVLCWVCMSMVFIVGELFAQAPAGAADSYGYHLTTGITVDAGNGVLSNDTGNNLTAVLQDNVQNGTLTLDATGAFTYVPNEGFTGDDTFTYFANDGNANSALVNVTLAPTPLLNVIITATGANVPVNDVAVFGPLGFGLDPGAFNGLVDPNPASDANDPFDAPANPPILFGSPAILAIDNPEVTTTDLRYDARFFDDQVPPTPASATFTLKYDFGSPANDITLTWDATLFQSGGAVFDAGYTVAEVRRNGATLTTMDTGTIVLTGPNPGNIDFVLARGNVAPVAFDDQEIVIFRSEAGDGIAIDVLANDRDADGDPLSILAADATTTKGGFTSHNGSIITYTPPIQTTFAVTAGTKTAAHPQFNIGSTNGYLIDGIEGRELWLKRGASYTFHVNAPGHPFYFTNGDPVGGPTGTPYNNGEVSGAPNQSGTVTFAPNGSTPDLLYYVCQAHVNMGWKIHIVDTAGEATGLVSDPDDESTFDTFSYTVEDDKSATDVGEVSVVVLSGLIRATRSHAATAPTTGPNRGLEVTVTVNYANDVGIDRIEITEVMPRTDEAFDTYSIPASSDAGNVGGLAVFNDANNVIKSIVEGADDVTFIWDGSTPLPPNSFSFTYHVVGPVCENDPDNNCDTKTKLFEAGTLDFTTSGQAQPTVPMATSNFTPEPFPIAISSYTLVTGEPNAASPSTTFDVSLRVQPSNPVTITLTSSDSAEGDVSDPGNTLTFGIDDFDTPQTVTLTGGNDDVSDDDQDYTLSVVASGDAPYNGATGIINATNEDDDVAGLEVVNDSPFTNESGTVTQIAVRLTSEPVQDVTVTVTLPDTLEVDYASPASHTFKVGAAPATPTHWNSFYNFEFSGVDDDIDDGDQQVDVAINVTGTDPKYAPLTIPSETITNIDDDTAGVSVSDNSDNAGEPRDDVDVTDILTSESGFTRQLWVRLRAQPPANTTVNITLGGTDLGEASLSPNTLTFGIGDWDSKQLVEITGQDDNLDDGNASYTVDFAFDYSNVSGSVGVNGTNLDNEMAGLVVTPQAGLITDEGGAQVFLVVKLMGPPSDSVVVDITGVDASEGLLSDNQLTFTTSNWFQSKTVTVTGVNSLDGPDGDVAYALDFALTSNDANFGGKFGTRVVITNLDLDANPDAAQIGFSPTWLDFGDVLVGESKTLHVTLNSLEASEFTYTIASDVAVFSPDANATVPADGTGAVAITFSPTGAGSESGIISFTEGDGAGVVKVNVIGNGVDTADGALLVNPTNVVAKPANATDDQVTVSLDVELTAADLVQLDFTLGYPANVLAVDTVTSSIADALIVNDINGSIHFEYMDVGAGSLPAGVVLSVTGTASTTNIGAWPLSLRNVSTTPKDVVLQVSGGQLDVSDDISLASLDVTGEGTVNTDDLILVFRFQNLVPFGLPLIPTDGSIAVAVPADEVQANVEGLLAGGDISGEGTWNTDDLILVFRYQNLVPFGLPLIPTDGSIAVPDGTTDADVEARILALFP
jgi:hypothetical protein